MEYVITDERLKDYTLQPNAGDAGIDLRACVQETVGIRKGELLIIHTGLKLAIPEHWVGLLIPRSGMGAKFGLTLGNTVGVIDSTYRGELLIAATNRKEATLLINPMDRIAQLVVVPYYDYTKMLEVEALDDTERGSSGFGDSGRR